MDRPRDSVAGIAVAVLRADPQPRLFLDPLGTILWRNPAAADLLATCPVLEVRDNQLVAEDRAAQPLLADFLAGDDGAALRTLCLPCSDGDGHLLLQASNVREGEAERAVSLTIRRTGSRFEARYADLRAAFGLTNAEHQIVNQLVRGRTAEDIACETGSSIGTVRTHIRSIYAKLDVSSREMFFYRLRPFRIL